MGTFAEAANIDYRLSFADQEKQTSEPELLNIQWRLKSRLFKESFLFKGQSIQQGSQWL